jgi:hypothetical protein
VEVSNCDVSRVSSGIFYKHTSLGNVQTVIKNNFLHNNAGHAIWMSSDHAVIKNNLIIGGNIDMWEDAGGTGGSNSSVRHNTVYGGSGMDINGGGQLGPNGAPGAIEDTVVNNVFSGYTTEFGQLTIWDYQSPYNTNTVSDYNCYYNGASNNAVREFNTFYALAQWQPHSSQDAHSVQSQPIFTNATGQLNTISDFKLTSTSAGYRAASDGTDMGANVDLIGPGGEAKIKGEQAASIASGNRTVGIRVTRASATGFGFSANLEGTGAYQVSVLDVAGRKVWKANFVSRSQHQEIRWNNCGIGNGTYVVVLKQNHRQMAMEFAAVR